MSVKIRRERRLLIAVFLFGFYFTTSLSYPTSLCAQRSSKKCTSIACWTARFFLRKKLSKKAFYLFGLAVLPLVTAFGSWFKVILFAVLYPLRLPRWKLWETAQLAKQKRNGTVTPYRSQKSTSEYQRKSETLTSLPKDPSRPSYNQPTQ